MLYSERCARTHCIPAISVDTVVDPVAVITRTSMRFAPGATPRIRATRGGAVTGDETRHVSPVPARVGGGDEGRAVSAAREIDRRDDPAGEVRMWRDAAVEDRDADAATGHAQLPPGVRRANLEDPGTRGERGAARRIEGRHH